MQAIQITEFGGPEVMSLVDIPEPIPSAGEILLVLTGIGINYADTHQIENSYLSAQKLPLVPGMEATGITSDGKRYLAFTSSGAYAQKATAPLNSLIPIPEGITDGEALSLLVQGSTALLMLKNLARVQPEQSILVHAAAGGVGSLAVQLAKHFGATVIAVVSNEEKREFVASLGADVVIDSNPDGMEERIRGANQGRGVDLVLEMVGGTTFDESFRSLSRFGHIITFGMASRKPPAPLHPEALMNGSKRISGFWLVDYVNDASVFGSAMHELFELVLRGVLTPSIDSTFGLSQARQAHEAILARETIGKVVLDPNR